MIKSNTVICSAKKCYCSIVTHPHKSFFGFPSDISLCKIWLENCGRTDLNLQHVRKSSHWRLCEDHFEDKWFTDHSKKLLKRKLNPVPTIFLNNINSLLPTGTDPDSIDVDSTSNPADSLCMELVEEGNGICDYSVSLSESSSKTQCLPISYHSKQLLNSGEFSDKTDGKTLLNCDPDNELNRIDQMCRFCLNNVSCNYIEMFSETCDAKEIRKISESILPNKVSICDGLPHKVCEQCTADLKTCQRLMEQFQNADQYLRAIAKYSLFIENEDTTEEEPKDKTCDDTIRPTTVPKSAMSLPLSNFKSTLQGYEYLDEINIDSPLEEKDKFCKTALTSNNSNDYESLSLRRRKRNEYSVKTLTSNLKKHKQILNHDSKFYKKYKELPSQPPQEFKNQIILLTQGHHDPRVITKYQTLNFGIVNPIEEIIFTGLKCSHCSELFNSDEVLQQHVKSSHEF